MTDFRLDGPVTILVLLGLTLPEVSEGDLAKIRAAAAPGSTIRVAPQVRDALAMADEVAVILGFIPEALFHAAPRLHWVHAIAAGVDMFLYPAMRTSHVVLTGEKGLVNDSGPVPASGPRAGSGLVAERARRRLGTA